MNALQEIGFKKAVKFIAYTLVSTLLHWVIIPHIRVFIMKLLGAKIGKETIIHDVSFSNLYHYGFSKINIKNRCFIGEEVMIDCRGGIDLDNDVTISNRSNLVTHINVGYADHPLQTTYPTEEKKIVIKRGAYIGTAATILPGVVIGELSVVAAGAVVTKSVPDRTVVAGVPAKMIKKLPAL